MSDPWLKVYAADMRGDPKIRLITLADEAMLIHAWDIAKQSPVYGELRHPSGKVITPAEFRGIIGKGSVRDAERFYAKVLDRALAELAEDGALRFGSLERRQGRDRAAAQRMRRYRDKHRNGYGDVTGTVTPPVTAQRLRSQKKEPPYPPHSGGDDHQQSWEDRQAAKRHSDLQAAEKQWRTLLASGTSHADALVELEGVFPDEIVQAVTTTKGAA